MSAEEDAYHELCAYTLTRGDPAFIHQHVVDSWAAQHAHAESKPITVFFALVGLYLHIERGFTGREVQLAHIALAKRREAWPVGVLPAGRGAITAVEVMAAPAGDARDAMIHRWCAAVWAAYAGSPEQIVEVLHRREII